MTNIVGLAPCFNEDTYFIDHTYLNFVRESMAGEVKIILSPKDLKGCSTLLLTGGRDIDCTIFGQNNLASKKVFPAMDRFHINCIDEAIKNGINIFGICRGFQLLYYTLLKTQYMGVMGYVQNIEGHNQQALDVSRGGDYHSVYNHNTGENEFVNSMHHQCVVVDEKVSIPCIKYTTDFNAPKAYRIVEGFTFKKERSLVAGVQWHPEEKQVTNKQYLSFFNDCDFLR